VWAARERQISRQGVLNSQLSDGLLRERLSISDGARSLLTEAIRRIGISARGFSRVLRVATTIADLSGRDLIDEEIVAEAVSYRSLDKLASIIHGVMGRARAA
jgi:magnesium chelatase family protein